MLETFILIFALGRGAGTAEFNNLAACLEANNILHEIYTYTYYHGVCVPKGQPQ